MAALIPTGGGWAGLRASQTIVWEAWNDSDGELDARGVDRARAGVRRRHGAALGAGPVLAALAGPGRADPPLPADRRGRRGRPGQRRRAVLRILERTARARRWREHRPGVAGGAGPAAGRRDPARAAARPEPDRDRVHPRG